MRPFDSDGKFKPAEGGGGLRRLAVRGASVTVIAQGLAFAIQMIATIVLARLLTPADFGVVTMVTTFSLLLMSFGQNGYTEAVIQREEMDHSLASNLFWINVGVGLVFAIAFAGAGSILARFYGDQRVTRVAIGISLTIFISGTSVLHLALLKRALRFTATSINDVLSGIISVFLMVVLAWAGWGYWALVAGTIARPLSQSVGAWFLCRWVPGLPRRANGTSSVVRFALNVYGRFSLNYSTRNMDNLLVGWRFGPTSLGFYKKAYDLFVLAANQLLSPVQEVALSTLSRLDRNSPQYRRYFLNGLSLLAFAGMGIGACLTLEARDLIRLLLGPQWDTSARIFMLFGPGIGIMLIYNTSGLIHLSIGKAHRWLRWGIVELAVTGVLFLLGLRWGPAGVAAAWTVSFWILTFPAFWYAGRPIHFGVRPVITIVMKYAFASLVAGFASAVIVSGISPLATASGILGAAIRIVAVSSMFAVLYIGSVILLHGGYEPLRQFGRLLPELLPSSRARRAPSPAEAPGLAPDTLERMP